MNLARKVKITKSPVDTKGNHTWTIQVTLNQADFTRYGETSQTAVAFLVTLEVYRYISEITHQSNKKLFSYEKDLEVFSL